MQRLIRLKEVIRRTGKGRSSIYKAISNGQFPPPVQIGERSSAWVEEEVSTWIEARIQQRGRVCDFEHETTI
jgi:prophage regulatory protein